MVYIEVTFSTLHNTLGALLTYPMLLVHSFKGLFLVCLFCPQYSLSVLHSFLIDNNVRSSFPVRYMVVTHSLSLLRSEQWINGHCLNGVVAGEENVFTLLCYNSTNTANYSGLNTLTAGKQ